MKQTDNDTALILSVKGNSLDDGPGIRSVVFFKGCPLSCVWCHNPESRKAGAEISFEANRCVQCGACRECCPEGALSETFIHYVDRRRCTLCFKCVDICPSGALTSVGVPMTVREIMDRILPDRPFFTSSGGGVTLSGGEPTLSMAFVSDLLKALKTSGIHTLLETCGHFDLKMFTDLVYPYLDAIYYDIKIIDNRDHKTFCGTSNERIRSNFSTLSFMVRKDGKTLVPRTPLIPGLTDSKAQIKAIASFYKKLGIRCAALLEYNPLWHDKLGMIGLDFPYQDLRAMTSFADKSRLERAQALFEDAGIHVIH